VAVSARRESAKIFLSRYARRTAPASLGGGRRPGAVSAGCGAGGGCKLPAPHRSAFGRPDLQDVAGFTINHIGGIMCPPSPADRKIIRRNALLRRARYPDLLRGFPLQPLDQDQRGSWSDDIRLSDLEPCYARSAASAALTCGRFPLEQAGYATSLGAPGGYQKGANYD
jgi:hypothetical protein